MRGDEPGGQRPPPAPGPRSLGYGRRHAVWSPRERPVLGPAAVPDDDGLENLLVHVIGIDGEWLWSGIVPQHYRMDEVQKIFQLSDRERFGLRDGHWYKLLWDFHKFGPYPLSHPRCPLLPPERPVHVVRMDLTYANGVMRSPDSREVWITAIKVLVI